MIISINTEKAFEKVRHPFIIKALRVEIETKFLNLLKNTYEKLTGNNKINGEKLNAYDLNTKKKKTKNI